ncbi:MAG: BLUF domain-containing protein [Polyangiales bacterium]
MQLKRIKYVSRQKVPMSREEIDDIVRVSAENNPRRSVTGAMMASGTVFFQILEGPGDAVDALVEVIRNDPRHVDFVCLGVQEVCSTRLFPEWAMTRLVLEAHPRGQELEARLADVVASNDTEATEELARLLWAELRAA